MNKLAGAAFAWSEGDGCVKDDLYCKIESIVKRVLSKFGNDLTLFEEIDQEFDAFLNKERCRAEAEEQRALQFALSKAQLQAAHRRASEEIEGRLEGYEVPEVVAVLLRETWRDVLLLISLRQGTESKAWHNALSLMDKILWSVKPKFETLERQKLLKCVPAIFNELREGLTRISCDPCKIASVFKCLQACHVIALRADQNPSGEQRIENLCVQDQMKYSSIEDIVLEGMQIDEKDGANGTAENREDNVYSAQVESLIVGTWLEIIDESGDRNRVKLFWRNVADESLVFVNRRGIKTTEMSVKELAALFQIGNVKVLNDLEAPLMDRAFSSMVDVLENMEEKYFSQMA